jgi:hypothetical protein
MPASSIARPTKIYPNLNFGLKSNHLATLETMHVAVKPVWGTLKTKLLFQWLALFLLGVIKWFLM